MKKLNNLCKCQLFFVLINNISIELILFFSIALVTLSSQISMIY